MAQLEAQFESHESTTESNATESTTLLLGKKIYIIEDGFWGTLGFLQRKKGNTAFDHGERLVCSGENEAAQENGGAADGQREP